MRLACRRPDNRKPGSPLGRAIVGAAVGATATYRPRRGATLSVTVRSAGELMVATA
jgi:hypothetical protein